ncbi:MAG TPA: hypothetical protein VNT79_18390, partial [Phycisphaerae bacterium]|nr:hypothetical protein [Phycisphaerae bacterium]
PEYDSPNRRIDRQGEVVCHELPDRFTANGLKAVRIGHRTAKIMRLMIDQHAIARPARATSERRPRFLKGNLARARHFRKDPHRQESAHQATEFRSSTHRLRISDSVATDIHVRPSP